MLPSKSAPERSAQQKLGGKTPTCRHSSSSGKSSGVSWLDLEMFFRQEKELLHFYMLAQI